MSSQICEQSRTCKQFLMHFVRSFTSPSPGNLLKNSCELPANSNRNAKNGCGQTAKCSSLVVRKRCLGRREENDLAKCVKNCLNIVDYSHLRVCTHLPNCSSVPDCSHFCDCTHLRCCFDLRYQAQLPNKLQAT